MDQTDTTGVTLEFNQIILLKEILEELVSWFGKLFLQVELQFPSTPMNSTECITVLNCSLVSFLRENNEKQYVFQQDNVRVQLIQPIY